MGYHLLGDRVAVDGYRIAVGNNGGQGCRSAKEAAAAYTDFPA